MTAPTPEPIITGRLHGGPRDGESLRLPWARYYLDLIRWEGQVLVEDRYALRPPWRGGDADYDFMEPATEREAA